jgi:hypothetical protein
LPVSGVPSIAAPGLPGSLGGGDEILADSGAEVAVVFSFGAADADPDVSKTNAIAPHTQRLRPTSLLI